MTKGRWIVDPATGTLVEAPAPLVLTPPPAPEPTVVVLPPGAVIERERPTHYTGNYL